VDGWGNLINISVENLKSNAILESQITNTYSDGVNWHKM
jgi:hypothetical protein